MTDRQTLSTEILRIVLNAVRYTAPAGIRPEIPALTLVILLVLKSGAKVRGAQNHGAALDTASDPGPFTSALTAAARTFSLSNDLPDSVAQRLSEEVGALEGRTLQDFWESLPPRRWWTRQRLARFLRRLHGLVRGEPNEGAAGPWGELLARVLTELQPKAQALAFSTGSGLGWSVETRQSLVELGRDLNSVTMMSAFATSEAALLTSLVFEAIHGVRLQSGPHKPRQEFEVSDGEILTPAHPLPPAEFDAVFSVWSQPEWAPPHDRAHYNAEAELHTAFDAVRSGGSLYLLTSLETLVNVPQPFTDSFLPRRDALTAVLVMPTSWVRRRGYYPDVILVIQPTKPTYLRDRVLIVDGTEIDQPQTDQAIVELLSRARQGLRTVVEGGSPAGPIVTTINSRRLARTHYQAALEPELAHGRQEDHEERVEILRAQIVSAHDQWVAAAQGFRERLAEIQRAATLGNEEEPA